MWPLGILGVWFSLVAAVELLRPPQFTGSLCLFRNVTGMPCPTCGSTRAVMALMRGQIIQAATFNPFLMAAILCSAAWFISPRAMRRTLNVWLRGHSYAIGIALVIALAANWIYIFWSEM